MIIFYSLIKHCFGNQINESQQYVEKKIVLNYLKNQNINNDKFHYFC